MATKTPIICYSSEVGNFERVWDPAVTDQYFHYQLASDRHHKCKVWETRRIKTEEFASPRLANRFQKMLYSDSLPRAGFSIYVDANVRIVSSLKPVLEAFERSGADIGLYPHYSHKTLAEEVSMCVRRGKVANPSNALHEIDHYSQSGFPDSGGMWEGSVIFKRHDSSRLLAAMEEWWELYSRFQTRDQFSLPFVIWKHGLTVFDLDDHKPGREHYFVRLQHSQAGIRNHLARYLQARAPENAFWRNLQRLARSLAKT